MLWDKAIIADFLSGKKILLESSAEIPLAELKKHPLVIAYHSTRQRNELLEQAKNAKLSAACLKDPHFYLSRRKFAEKISAPEINSEETPFLLKIALWNLETETGDREEITLEREEYGMFDALADNEGPKDDFFANTLEQAGKTDIILMHQYSFARGLAERLDDRSKRSLIIIGASYLEDSFTNAFRKKYTESTLRPFVGAKATMAFGLLGIFYDRYADPEMAGYRGNVIMDEVARSSSEWQRAFTAFENLPDFPKKQEILTTFRGEENAIQWIASFAEELSFNSASIQFGALFQKRLSPFKNALIQSEALSGDGSFGLTRELLELDSSWQEIKEKTRLFSLLDLKIPEDFPEPFSGGYFKACIKLFMKIIEEKRGRCLFLLSSKKAVEATYQTLLPKMPKLDVKMLAVGPSGGIGKSLALFLENPEKAVLFATNQILQHLEQFEHQIDTIVFQKIPFDPPSDPLLSRRSSFFENGFKDYTLPRAIMRFREILAELGRDKGKNDQPKTCHLLDSRLLSRDYGELFI